MYSTECISYAYWNPLHSMICEKWLECPAQFPALTAWQFTLLAYQPKPRMCFPMLFIVFCLEVWKIAYGNKCGNLLFLVLTFGRIFFSDSNFPTFCYLITGNCTDESFSPGLLHFCVLSQFICGHWYKDKKESLWMHSSSIHFSVFIHSCNSLIILLPLSVSLSLTSLSLFCRLWSK